MKNAEKAGIRFRPYIPIAWLAILIYKKKQRPNPDVRSSDGFRLSLRFPLCSEVKTWPRSLELAFLHVKFSNYVTSVTPLWRPNTMRCKYISNPKYPHLRMVMVLKSLGLAIGNYIHPILHCKSHRAVKPRAPD